MLEQLNGCLCDSIRYAAQSQAIAHLTGEA